MSTHLAGAPPVSTRWRPGRVVHVAVTLAPLRRGRGDPAFRVDHTGALWRAVRTPAGPGTLRLTVTPAAGEVLATGWGPGGDWLVAGVPDLLGRRDDDSGFQPPEHPRLHAAYRRYPGLRLTRTNLVLDALVPAVLEQKVTGLEAWRSWRELLWRFGEPAPGPVPPGLRVPPSAAGWAAIPSWEWHRAGVDGKRARTIVTAARVAGRLEECLRLPPPTAINWLASVPGVGAWTAAEVAQRAWGDPDTVSVGDYHLPSLVSWALADRRRGDDADMLDLLDPYRPHRQRVIRLLELSGSRPPRRAPRAPIRDYRNC